MEKNNIKNCIIVISIVNMNKFIYISLFFYIFMIYFQKNIINKTLRAIKFFYINSMYF
jgi:hypothetical protein